MTYLGKESDRAVDFARGAMGSLLDKLGKLVKEDYNLETSVKRDIESFSQDLMTMHQDLRNLKNLNGVRIWVDEVRDMSYHIEDIVDGFLVHVEHDSDRSDFKELTHESLNFLEDSMRTRYQIGDVIRDIKDKVQAVANRGKEYSFDANNVVANATTQDIRISAIYEDNEHLVGIEAPRDELITLFKEDSDISKIKAVSSVGLGKTTLAKVVYDKLKEHYHQIGDVIRDIKNKVQAVASRGKKYNFDVNNVVTNATTVDIQVSGIYEDNEQLIGIEAPRDELTRLFKEDDNISKLKTVSIVGLGGLGKTTLAKAVYVKLKAHYHPKAFVSVGQNPDVKIVLKNIIIDCQSQEYNAAKLDYLDAQQLINELRKLLEDKRYFIVIDDVWDSSSWNLIKSAFPKNNHGSIVITTTRIERVARDCCKVESKYIYWMKPLSVEDSRRLFLRRIFGPGKDCPDAQKGISTDILKKCDGMPLAINSIASLLAGEPESTWDYVKKTLGAMTEGDDHEKMKQILDLSYIHLPDHLKTCMLYVCMYPEDREIDKDDLLRKWVAEGFVHVSKNSGLDAEDVAGKYFKELISMCMIQPGKLDDYSNEVLSCRVHDIILDLMRSKSSKENFIHVIDVSKDETGACGPIHRVSVQYDGKKDMRVLEPINKGSLSHVRSVLLYRSSDVPCFLEFKYVRVLHLELRDYSNEGLDLTGISGLFLLRYLKVTSVYRTGYELKLPNKIGELQQLETIDLQGVMLKNCPSDLVSLPWLSHLSSTRHFGKTGIALPDGIERLKSMRTLEGVSMSMSESSVENIKGISKLTKLRILHILLGGLDRPRVDALHSSICRLSTSLRVLRFEGREVEVPGWGSRTLFPRGSCIGELDLRGCKFERCPKWIGQLHHLYKFIIMVREVADCVSIVAGLPSLSCFKLLINTRVAEKRESVVIPGGGAFRALKHLTFFCKYVKLTFRAGAMPKLERLQIWFPHGMDARSLPVGIRHLPAGILKYIWLSVACADNPYFEEYDPYGSVWIPDACAASLKHHNRAAGDLLTDAFKPHHPTADIRICFDEGISGDGGDDRDKYGDPWV
uniref:Uncharacterized protein n=1 Tax=Avena sativa TaxID=4498 RepID=A0ACD5TZT2_AVESA